MAIDIGGTKTIVAKLNKDGRIIKQVTFPTNKDYYSFINDLAKNVAKISTDNVRQIVVALPGKIDRKNGVGLAFGNLAWENVPIKADLEKILHTPVVIENDAKLAALAEAKTLMPKYGKILYVTISTGIGAGLINQGKIDPKFEDMEAGQMLLEYKDKLTDWEDFASGKAFQQKFGKKVSEMSDKNQEAWYWFARNIALGLLNLAAVLTPEAIVIGGGAGQHLEKFKDRLLEQLKIYENPMFKIPPILKAKKGNNSVIYGCYEFAKQH